MLEGQFVFADRQLWKVKPGENPAAPRVVEPATRQDVEDATRTIYQLSFDGITLVDRRERPGPPHHQGSLEAERGNEEPARSPAGGGRGPHEGDAAQRRGLLP